MSAIVQPLRNIFPDGYYAIGFSIAQLPQVMSAAELLQLMSSNPFSLTGWPFFITSFRGRSKPYYQNGEIECWLGAEGERDPAHSDFWRASPKGQFFIARGYQEDGQDMRPHLGVQRKGFDLTLPVWRLGEVFLYAADMAKRLGNPSAPIAFKVEYSGLTDRELGSWGNRQRMIHGGHISRVDSFETKFQVQADQIESSLPELVAQVVYPLYEVFDFAQPTRALVPEELQRMRKRQI